MLTVHFGASGRANVWLDRHPGLPYEAIAIPERVLLAPDATRGHPRAAAIEWFRPTCGPSTFGLLGGHFTPDTAGRLLVRVLASSYDGKRIADDLRPRDLLRAGLPEEYTGYVLQGAGGAEHLLGSGKLTFDCAAHGAVGSSGWVFFRLTRAVTWLLTREPDTVSGGLLRMLLGDLDRYFGGPPPWAPPVELTDIET
jgi:hypothetical protein